MIATAIALSTALGGCDASGDNQSDATSEPADTSVQADTSDQSGHTETKTEQVTFKAPITQPAEFILQKAQGLSDWLIEGGQEALAENWSDIYVKGNTENKYGPVTTFLYRDPVPLEDSKIASGIGQKVIDKVNDIAQHPDEYGVEIHLLNAERFDEEVANPQDYNDCELIYGDKGLICNPHGNDMIISVSRYAFNNIIAYSINFSVPDPRVTSGSQGEISHHAMYRFGMNFDAATGEQISWEDIFADNVSHETELSKYLDYLSFINETPRIERVNPDKMFLLTPTYILLGNDPAKLHCGVYVEIMPSNGEIVIWRSGNAFFRNAMPDEEEILVDIQYSESDIPLRFFGENVAFFERFKSAENLFDSSVEIESLRFPTRTIYDWIRQN